MFKKPSYPVLALLLAIFMLSPILNFSFAQEETSTSLPEIQISPPKDMEEAQQIGEEFLDEAKEKMPGILEKIWNNDVRPLWTEMWNWTKNKWETHIYPVLQNFFEKTLKPKFEKEIEKREPIIKEELEKEKQELREELKQEAPKIKQSLWERFKKLFE